jgi:hypothetical protein
MTVTVPSKRRKLLDRRRGVEAAALVLFTFVFSGMYVVTDAPLYNPVGTIDPWLYTALWVNFDQIYHHFLGTYYASRVPWIAPGYGLNLLFDHRTAYFIMHVSLFFGGALLFYIVCRRWFGVLAALAAYIGLVGNQMYFNEHRWDYESGGALTFVIASIAFALPKTTSPRRRATSFALAGFFGAAAVTTLIVDSVYLAAGLPLLYFALLPEWDGHSRLSRLLLDLSAFAAGGLLLLLAGGTFAKSNGGEFLFFMPQLRAVFGTTSEGYQQALNVWFPKSPYFFFPIFVALLGVVVMLLHRPSSRATRRLLLAAAAWTALIFAGLSAWQFGGTGFLLGYSYYFSAFLVPTLFTLAAVVAAILEPRASRDRWSWIVVALIALAVLATGIWIFRSDRADRIASGVTHGAYLAMLVAMAVTLALVVLSRVLRTATLAAVALVLAFFSVTYSADASYGTWIFGYSDQRTGALYDLGSKMTNFLRENGFHNDLPYFWYDVAYAGGTYASLQSLYYFGYTYIGLNLPKVTNDFRARMTLYRPRKLVLLCPELRCRGAAPALARGGYPVTPVRTRLLRDGPVHVWVEIYRLRPAPVR